MIPDADFFLSRLAANILQITKITYIMRVRKGHSMPVAIDLATPDFDEDYLHRLRAGDYRTQEHFVGYFRRLLQHELKSRLRSPRHIQQVREETFSRFFHALRSENAVRDPKRLRSVVTSTCLNVWREYSRRAPGRRSESRAALTPAETSAGQETLPKETLPKETLHKETLQWRRQFISRNPCWNSAEVAAESSSLAANRAAIASRWLAERKIFAVRFEGKNRFPRFQFRDGAPIPAVAQVIREFPEHATGWELAYFFATPNPNLGGHKPLDLLASEPSRLQSLARAFAHPADVF